MLPLFFLFSGCAASSQPAAPTQGPVGSSTALPASRAIIYFQHPAVDSAPLSTAIADACDCQPIFFRQFAADALIYEIALPQGHTFAEFEQALLQKAGSLGIKAVEEDRIMRHQ